MRRMICEDERIRTSTLHFGMKHYGPVDLFLGCRALGYVRVVTRLEVELEYGFRSVSDPRTRFSFFLQGCLSAHSTLKNTTRIEVYSNTFYPPAHFYFIATVLLMQN